LKGTNSQSRQQSLNFGTTCSCRALGIDVPPTLPTLGNEVIE
jgi:hypothetical protein